MTQKVTSILQISWHSLLSRPTFTHDMWRASRTDKQTEQDKCSPPSAATKQRYQRIIDRSFAVEILAASKTHMGERAHIWSGVRACLGGSRGFDPSVLLLSV